MDDHFREIPGRIEQTLSILQAVERRLDRFEAEVLPKLGKTSDSVLIPVQLLENGYTAVETVFVRISQTFENTLDAHRRHSHLLEKMTLEIPESRPRVISDALYRKLAELMRFRHFKRYYFELEYDWRKIDVLIQIFREVVPMLDRELRTFAEKITAAGDQ